MLILSNIFLHFLPQYSKASTPSFSVIFCWNESIFIQKISHFSMQNLFNWVIFHQHESRNCLKLLTMWIQSLGRIHCMQIEMISPLLLKYFLFLKKYLHIYSDNIILSLQCKKSLTLKKFHHKILFYLT